MSDTRKSIVGGMTILSVVGLICKVVGALYRIPLAWLIGEQGMGTYQLVFPTYNMLLTISSAGLPVAISRMVSYCLARDDPRNARRVMRVAASLLTSLGFIAMLLMVVFSPSLARRSGDMATEPGFVAIAPALLLVCTMSALRGFMQGQRNMVPTAISQLIEQVGKVFIALPLAFFGSRISIAYAAAGVLLGTSAAEAAALLYMYIAYRRNKRSFAALKQDDDKPAMGVKPLIGRLMSLSVPITLGACIVPLSAFIDSGFLLNRLVSAGIERTEALGLYGRYSGYVLTLINVPTAIAAAISMSLVPSISDAMAREDTDEMRRQCALGLRLSFVVGLPCSLGMSLMSERLLSLIYRFSSPEALRVTANLLSLSSLTIVLFTVVQSTSGILQGMRKQRIPMYTLMLGVAVKIVLNYTLIGTPGINIYGAPIASICCYTISMIPNLYYVLKHTGARPDWRAILLKPALASAVMGAAVGLGVWLLPKGRLWTLALLLAAVACYFIVSVRIGAITDADIAPLRRRLHKRK